MNSLWSSIYLWIIFESLTPCIALPLYIILSQGLTFPLKVFLASILSQRFLNLGCQTKLDQPYVAMVVQQSWKGYVESYFYHKKHRPKHRPNKEQTKLPKRELAAGGLQRRDPLRASVSAQTFWHSRGAGPHLGRYARCPPAVQTNKQNLTNNLIAKHRSS